MTFKRHLNKPHLNMLHIKKFDYEMSPRQRIVMYHHVTYYIPSIWYLLKCHLVNITYNCIIPICRITLDDKSTNSSPSQCKMSNCNDVNSVESSLMTFYKLIAYEYFVYENVTYANKCSLYKYRLWHLVHMLLILVSLN